MKREEWIWLRASINLCDVKRILCIIGMAFKVFLWYQTISWQCWNWSGIGNRADCSLNIITTTLIWRTLVFLLCWQEAMCRGNIHVHVTLIEYNLPKFILVTVRVIHVWGGILLLVGTLQDPNIIYSSWHHLQIISNLILVHQLWQIVHVCTVVFRSTTVVHSLSCCHC